MNHKIKGKGHFWVALILGVFGCFASGVFGQNSLEGRRSEDLPGVIPNQRLVSDPSKRLQSLVVEVNGERRLVEPNASLDLVAGDLLTIVEAHLVDKNHLVKAVDLVGYRSRLSNTLGDDRGRVIDTARHLSRKRSLSRDGRQYRIEVYSADGVSGEIILNIQEPELISFEIEVNGALKKLSSNDKLLLSSKDLVRVVDIRTNVRGNENVKYNKFSTNKSNEIRFSRGGRVFARIPIEWQGR